MVKQSLLDTIEYLKQVNSAEGEIDVYALGDDAQENMSGDIDERFSILQVALIANLLETVKTSNDQISVGLEINRLMWFHGMGLCPDKEFWRQKYREHGAAMRFGFDSSTAGINLAAELINTEVEAVNNGSSPLKSEWVNALQTCIDTYNNERIRLGDCSAAYGEVNDKIARRVPHYSEEQKPDVSGIDLRGCFLAIHNEVLAQSAEAAASANINVAKTLLTRGSLIEQRVMPNRPPEETEQLRQNVAKMHDNVTASLERAAVWLDIQAISEGYRFPETPNPS